MNIDKLSKKLEDSYDTPCRKCTLCEDDCARLDEEDIDGHVKKNWIKHWKQHHPFELSVLKHKDSVIKGIGLLGPPDLDAAAKKLKTEAKK